MDPYVSYGCGSNTFESSRNHRSKNLPPESSQVLLIHQQQQLPPFREILGPPLNTTTTESPSGDSLSHGQCDIMTRKTFHEPSLPPKSEPQSPDPSQTGNSTEGFDTMSARSVDSGYPLGCHERRTSSWAPASQYPELVSPYSTQQRMPYQSQPPYGPPRDNPSLPPIRDIDRMSTFDSPYSPTSNTYHPSFANPAGPQGGQDNYSYGSDRPSYYDSTHRYSQGYPPVNRQNPHLDFTRYAPSPYDYRAGVAYPSPYGTAEFASSPTGLHHPTSPTVAMDTNAQNRKRRGNLPRHITDILRTWFHDHLEHPYPTEDEKQILVARTNLTIAQISNWFINARRRQLPALRHAREREQNAAAAAYEQDQLRRQHQSDSAVR